MLLLFTSYVCDYCDGLADRPQHRGYIVLRPERIGSTYRTYVFPSEQEAATWRSANNLGGLEIREVRSFSPFVWIKSRGRLDVELAESTYQIYPDHKFPPGPRRAFIVDDSRAT